MFGLWNELTQRKLGNTFSSFWFVVIEKWVSYWKTKRDRRQHMKKFSIVKRIIWREPRTRKRRALPRPPRWSPRLDIWETERPSQSAQQPSWYLTTPHRTREPRSGIRARQPLLPPSFEMRHDETLWTEACADIWWGPEPPEGTAWEWSDTTLAEPDTDLLAASIWLVYNDYDCLLVVAVSGLCKELHKVWNIYTFVR